MVGDQLPIGLPHGPARRRLGHQRNELTAFPLGQPGFAPGPGPVG